MAIQNNINQMIGTVAAASTMGNHIKEQQTSNKLATISNIDTTNKELLANTNKLNELNNENEGLGEERRDLETSQDELDNRAKEIMNMKQEAQTALTKIDPNSPSDKKMKPKVEKNIKQYDKQLNDIEYSWEKNQLAMQRIDETIKANSKIIGQTETQRKLLEEKANLINKTAKRYGMSVNMPKTEEEETKEYINSLKGGKR